MSIALHGIGLGGGIAIGNAYILDRRLNDAVHRVLATDALDAEVNRFSDAIAETRRDLESLRDNMPDGAPQELKGFLALNLMMLSDSQIAIAPTKIIRAEECNAEWAIKLQVDKLLLQFENMEDEYLKERRHDVVQVFERIFENLEGNQFQWGEFKNTENIILAARDLSPADLVQFKNSNFLGFITEVGSLISHTAIVGRNLDVPAIIGVEYARQLIEDNDLIIVDGIQGVLIINPTEVILAEYRQRQQQWIVAKTKLDTIRKSKAVSLDGVEIKLYANIDGLDDLEEVNHNNASGIGLCRSEFLFFDREEHLLDEDVQFIAYKSMLKNMHGQPVVVRTADFGTDKNPVWNTHSTGALNPALGLVGIRLSLVEPGIFRTQLRALLRASVFGELQIMFPMISSAFEVKQAIHHIRYVEEELRAENVKFRPKIKIGAMIEVPSAALAIKSILALVDFVTIGTNDLIQYLLAIDRNDEEVNYLYNPLHPAVIKLLLQVVKECDKLDKHVSICGEMAGDVKLTRLLLGLGLRNFSVRAGNILNVKQVVLNTDIGALKKYIAKILKTDNPAKLEDLVSEMNQESA